jgi:hypothetical protein
MMNLSAHLSRHPMLCPVQLRAWAGGEAAHRLEDVKSAHFGALPRYQEIYRIWELAGPNLRAVIEDKFNQASAMMAQHWREYDRAVKAEHVISNLERKAA